MGDPAANQDAGAGISSRGDEITVLELAKELGYNENYDGDDKVDPATYIRRGGAMQRSMRDTISHLRKHASNIENAVEIVSDRLKRDHQREITGLKSQIETLKEQKKAAVQESDHDKVEELDGKIDAAKAQITDLERSGEPAQKGGGSGPDPAYAEWREKNAWYGDPEDPGYDEEMSDYADSIAQTMRSENAKVPMRTVLREIDRKMHDHYPEKFKKAAPGKRDDPPDMGGGGYRGVNESRGGFKPVTRRDLDEDQLRTMRQAVQEAGMTEDEYLKSYNEILKREQGRR